MTAGVTQQAIAAIAEIEPTADRAILPATHADILPVEAGNLARILRRPEFIRVIERFDTSDKAAGRFQARYKRLGRRAIFFHCVVALIGGTVLMANIIPDYLVDGGGRGSGLLDRALIFSPGLQAMVFVAALFTARLIFILKPFPKWMQARARAEIARVDLFNRATHADEEDRTGELPLLALQLEYFNRYQLDVQVSYYGERAREHGQVARSRIRRVRMLTAIAAFVMAPVGWFLTTLLPGSGVEISAGPGGGVMLSWIREFFEDPLSGLIFAWSGLVASALLSAQNSLSLLSQDERNANRYSIVHSNLVHLKEVYLFRARAAAADGDRNAVMSFIDTVNDQISSEHREWISLQEQSSMPDFDTIAASRLPLLGQR